MSLRRKDDWDEALEEARQNAIMRGELKPIVEHPKPKDYDWGQSIKLTQEEILGYKDNS